MYKTRDVVEANKRERGGQFVSQDYHPGFSHNPEESFSTTVRFFRLFDHVSLTLPNTRGSRKRCKTLAIFKCLTRYRLLLMLFRQVIILSACETQTVSCHPMGQCTTKKKIDNSNCVLLLKVFYGVLHKHRALAKFACIFLQPIIFIIEEAHNKMIVSATYTIRHTKRCINAY